MFTYYKYNMTMKHNYIDLIIQDINRRYSKQRLANLAKTITNRINSKKNRTPHAILTYITLVTNICLEIQSDQVCAY